MPYVRPEYKPSCETNAEWLADVRAGAVVMGCALNTTSPLVAELVSASGYDFCLVDSQHSACNPETIRNMFTAVHAGGAKAFIRVGGHTDRNGMQQALDCGADGVLVPCVRTAKDVHDAVSCCKYKMHGPGSDTGSRSVYVNLRPQLPGGFPALFNYVPQANSKHIVGVQIETAEALANIDEICKVPGLDYIFIGPGDLAIDMGLAREVGIPQCWSDERFDAAQKKIASSAAANGLVAGYWNSDLAAKVPLGFRLFVVDGDLSAMQGALATSLAGHKEKRDEALAALNKK